MKLFIGLVLFVALAATPLAVGITASKAKKRSCTVYLVGGGDAVHANFISATSTQLIVEVEGARRTIKLDHVANIVFVVDFKNRRVENVEP
ncbi:MAG TPA: hypothetical protein VGB73_08695 [Pyrinomonadaceae bacterium]|jgi:signal recognition particle receptor subunit beta